MQSNVGNKQINESGDQDPKRFEEGKKHAHSNNDSKDSRTIANKLASKSQEDNEDDPKSIEKKLLDEDATAPARAHGNEPSRGAKIDQQIREEEDEYLRQKGRK